MLCFSVPTLSPVSSLFPGSSAPFLSFFGSSLLVSLRCSLLPCCCNLPLGLLVSEPSFDPELDVGVALAFIPELTAEVAVLEALAAVEFVAGVFPDA